MRFLWLLPLCCTVLAAADLPLVPLRQAQDFEDTAPQVELWAHNGTAPTVHFLGLSDDCAASGRRSLKLDVTLGSGSYYYFGARLPLAVAGRLELAGQLRLAAAPPGARVGLGYNMVYPPSPHSGCSPLREVTAPSTAFSSIRGDLVARGVAGMRGVLANWTVNLTGDECAVLLDRWSLFLYGKAGDRLTVYLDDLLLEGAVPDLTAYRDSTRQRWEAAKAAFVNQVAGWRQELQGLRQAELPAGLPPAVAAVGSSVREAAQRAEHLLAKFTAQGTATPADVRQLELALQVLRHGPATVRAMAAALTRGEGCLVAPTLRPTGSRPPDAQPLLEAPVGGELAVHAAAGEVEAAAAQIYALRDLRQVRVEVPVLRRADGLALAGDADQRWVAWWYQGLSHSIAASSTRQYVPELLLHDLALIRVDRPAQRNELRSSAADGSARYLVCSDPDSTALAKVTPRDAATLQPTDLTAGSCQEVWLTWKLPPTTPAGRYSGELLVRHAEGHVRLPLNLTVQPFELPPPRLTYSIYYRGVLSPDDRPAIDSDRKSVAQMRAELANLRDHGVTYPTSYQPQNPQWAQAMELRREAGLPTDQFFDLGFGVGNASTPAALLELRQRVERFRQSLATYGYRDVHLYGFDEDVDERLTSQLAAWQTVQEAGARNYVACYQGTFEKVGARLNLAVLAGPPDAAEVAKWHGVGSRLFCYANPQVGLEDPAVYRRNFGLLLWQHGYDGAMDYAYQHGFHHVWNDFDDLTYRDHNFTYPTVDGIVDTLAWEGFREAVDDVRYLTLLEQRLAAAPQHAQAAAATAWLRGLDARQADLDALRQEAARWITALAP
ncbi:MAG: hypothetical protein IT204_14355 [Fimbriimonadaceae bacterium]|nr:hypothetical protein [Fimbriimonadaceae bacterium]